MSSIEIEQRQERARELFRQGYNCSQAVFASCADLFGVTDTEMALRLAASFGGGIGRMRLTCGAACGMFLLEGLHSGSAIVGDAVGKGHNYQCVQALAERFREEHGSLTCAELLAAHKAMPAEATSPTPEPRTENYYHKRPCIEMVAAAVRIFLESL